MSELVFAQISDCHLFADVNACHHHANVYQHLIWVLADIKKNSDVEFIIFTGDLSQDHSEASYQNFVQAIKQCEITVPVYFIAGNHDEIQLLNKYLTGSPFHQQQVISHQHWQLLLLNSKSETPAGQFHLAQFEHLIGQSSPQKHSFVFMHHNPIDVGYFIDRHHLTNQAQFWQAVEKHKYIKAVACGHVHRALTLLPENTGRALPLYTCPATSIQFDPTADTVKSLQQPPAYRLFQLQPCGEINSNIIFVEQSS